MAGARGIIVTLALAFAGAAAASEFATPGGPEPANVRAISDLLRRDPYDLELLISFGTSKGGSAGHLALAIRDEGSGEDVVHSANFYADRSPEHARGFYTAELMIAVPKSEYLFGTASSLGPAASFGLDFGEVYKRSVVGVRVQGVPADEKAALAAYFARINDDYRRRASGTEYHDREVRYDYLELNCAKTIGSAFRYGARYANLDITSSVLPSRRKAATALRANVPTDMAMKLMRAWHARGYRMDAILYRKYVGSPWVDPREEEKIAFGDLPNRFPSVLSRDFVRDEAAYRDYDNLYAAYLIRNLLRYRVRVDERTRLLDVEALTDAVSYPVAAERAAESARSDSGLFARGRAFRPKGTAID